MPTQSLELLNSDFVTAQARFFAVRLTNLSQDIETQVSHGWQLAFSQEISEDKKREAVEFVTQMQALLTKEYEAKKLNVSSTHFNFIKNPNEWRNDAIMIREGIQFHWENKKTTFPQDFAGSRRSKTRSFEKLYS